MSEAELHKLLMPPHPGGVYISSALCSCGEWQYDSVNAYNLTSAYRQVLKSHTDHIRLAVKDQARIK